MKKWADILTAINLSEDQRKLLTDALQDVDADGKKRTLEIVVSNNGEYLKAEKYDELQSKYNTLDKSYKDLEAVAGKSTELSSELEKLKTERATIEKRFDMEKRFIADKLPLINGGYDAYHLGIDYDKISKLQNGGFDGANEQYESFKTLNKSLYEISGTPRIDAGSGGNPPPVPKGYTKETFAKLPIKEQMQYANENPDALKELLK